MEDFRGLQNFINNLAITANPTSKIDEKDLQKIVISRAIKYMISRFS